MFRQYFSLLYDYNYWANEKILAQADKVSDADFIADRKFSWGSLRGTLVHILFAEQLWLARWQGAAKPDGVRAEDFPNNSMLRARWIAEEQKMRAFLATQDSASLEHTVHYKRMSGAPKSFPLWQLMMHVVNHGTQHRGEAAIMLTELGFSPGNIDFNYFLDERTKV
jgi:uncharacterized damage-inducible protein DinB